MSHVNEFSHTVRAEHITGNDYTVEFEANERQRELLAKRYGILSVDSLSGTGKLVRQADGLTIHLTGHVKAEVQQACVTTLEPVHEEISEDFQAYFLDESQVTSFVKAKKKKDEIEGPMNLDDLDERPIPEDHEDPEPVIGGIIDVGEIVAQHVALGLNPFPRSKKALETGPIGDEKDLKPASPFAILKDLISK